MADKATIQSSLRIQSGGLDYRSYPTSYQSDVSGSKGPTPGAITATIDGNNIDLSELTTPGWCEIRNLDQTNFIEVGLWDESVGEFHPFIEVGPEEHQIIKISRNFGESYAVTGTGTVDSDIEMRVRANTASCEVYIGAFEA